MQLFKGEFLHNHFFYSVWLVQRMGGECFLVLVGQVIVPIHLIEKRQIVQLELVKQVKQFFFYFQTVFGRNTIRKSDIVMWESVPIPAEKIS